MNLLDFIPFRNEMQKAYHGLTDNANHTSEHPVFDELKVRRYSAPMSEVSAFITDKIDRWVGWNLKNEKTAIGGMMIIRAEIFSFALLGTKIDVTFGLSEETDRHGHPITTINAKAETNIDSKGDLGESRRVIRVLLGAMDFEYRKAILKDDEYLFLSLDPKGSTQALQELFDGSKNHNKSGGVRKKSTSIEFKKKSSEKQTIELKPATKTNGKNLNTVSSEATNGSAASKDNGTTPSPSSKPKVTVIKLKKS
ncbi:MAG: hypothetical protein C1942_04330 [Prosthecochloris sp.]|uniref:hypothetical protein n=1 Tax=Prosthecochloris sp. TaxID=290513 RepID=UPI0013C7C6BF|nr:hypothetical protein [Prosthecochloris sp.]NEX11913.1 hypothetical protein [Prosthecochloris sp.]